MACQSDGCARASRASFRALSMRSSSGPACCGGDGGNRGAQQIQRIHEAVPEIACQRRARGRFHKPFPQRDKADGQIAAVHGRHIAGFERLQRPRIEPVHDMPPVMLDPFQCRQRVGGAGRDIAKARVAEIERRQRGQQLHPDVGGRRAMGDLFVGIGLIIVWRQPVVLGPRKGLEVKPGPPGDTAQIGLVGIRQRLGRGPSRAPDEPGDFGRGDPQQQQRCRPRQGLGSQG